MNFKPSCLGSTGRLCASRRDCQLSLVLGNVASVPSALLFFRFSMCPRIREFTICFFFSCASSVSISMRHVRRRCLSSCLLSPKFEVVPDTIISQIRTSSLRSNRRASGSTCSSTSSKHVRFSESSSAPTPSVSISRGSNACASAEQRSRILVSHVKMPVQTFHTTPTYCHIPDSCGKRLAAQSGNLSADRHYRDRTQSPVCGARTARLKTHSHTVRSAQPSFLDINTLDSFHAAPMLLVHVPSFLCCCQFSKSTHTNVLGLLCVFALIVLFCSRRLLTQLIFAFSSTPSPLFAPFD